MKNQTVGVDASSTFTVDNVTANPADEPTLYQYPDTPKKTQDYPTAVQIVNRVVTPTLQVLLYDVLGVIDASIPNKEQNRAVKRIIHDGFDKAYLEIVREAYPDSNFSMGPGHALTPLPDKSNAILGATIKM